MDSSVTTSISKSSINKLYFKGSYLRQNWSLPDSITYYLAKNPKSPKCYQKLIKSCKYFFSKNPIIVGSGLSFDDDDESSFQIELNQELEDIELKNISQSFWITDVIYIHVEKTGKRNVISSLIPNIYQCDVKELNLTNQTVSLNELLFLASKADFIYLSYSTVENEHGSVDAVEKIIEAFTQVKVFRFDLNENDQSISSKTVENLIKIPHFSNIDGICLKHISDAFDIETFYGYMKKNKHTYFDLDFGDSISELYENRLIDIADEIRETENHDYKIPSISIDGY